MIPATLEPVEVIPILGNKAVLDDFDSTLWPRLIKRIMDAPHFVQATSTLKADDREVWAQVILDQTIAFLRLCGQDTENAHAPSYLVDIGWHEFILYTKLYADFSYAVAGFFIHHIPDDEDPAPAGLQMVEKTVGRMQLLDIPVIVPAWPGNAKCHVVCMNNCKGEGGK